MVFERNSFGLARTIFATALIVLGIGLLVRVHAQTTPYLEPRYFFAGFSKC
jgi:hypothetical protein